MKTREERESYQENVELAPLSDETVERPPSEQEGLSAPPEIRGPAIPVGTGAARRIDLPTQYVIPVPTTPKSSLSLWAVMSVIGVGGVVAYSHLVFDYGSLTKSVDNNIKNVQALEKKQEKSRDHLGKIRERLAKLEAQVDAAVKSGAATADLALQVSSLRQVLESQQGQHGFLVRRIEALEARLASRVTQPSTP